MSKQRDIVIPAESVRPIPQEAFDWYDAYAHGLMDRRTFMHKLGTLTALGYSTGFLTAALMPDYVKAAQVSFNHPRIIATYSTFPAPKGHGRGRGYLVVPQDLQGQAPAVLVVHENRGLNPYIEDVARRLALQGYVAFAPDALYSLGGYPGNDDEGRAMQSSLERPKIEEDFIAAAHFLKRHELTTDKLGAVGFCFGGYIVNLLAATLGDELDAGVPFYGTPAAEALHGNIRAPLQLHFAGNDDRVNATWPDYEASLKAADVEYTAYVYEGVNHGFHNDSTARYAKDEAELAWSRTLQFFDKHLS
ncbi:dienelactone hydrolase family protein [Marinobacter sp. X15-166B]|uniref:dienelactone hydrolase family protein n=1 Tax=Marinobacter sp. X15-166B TaxID=1897620 RepID=UPI00085C1A78|nr:dienelactone hydrolase family protein [Marinobacter sp. X15-166B]OEY67587.1 dienelactone hydrolase [Marinobacter sp. X15-166B]